jgi:hypothetical protein
MIRYRQVMRVGESGGLEKFGRAADTRQIERQHIAGAQEHHLRRLAACVNRFSARDRRVERSRHFRFAAMIVRRHRLLKPVEAEFFQLAPEPDRFAHGKALVRVNHELDFRANRFSHGANACDILLADSGESHLEAAEARGDLIGRCTLQSVDRQTAPQRAALIALYRRPACAKELCDVYVDELRAEIEHG